VRRREFITLLGSAATAWPLSARTQQPDRMRRIGVLMNTGADEPESQARLGVLLLGLQELGWAVGRNLRIDYRWSPGDLGRLRKDAAELVGLHPEIILAGVGPTTFVLQQATRTIPIVMAQAIDPVGNGYIDSLAQPGGNTTGFTQFEYSLAGKWMELLKEVAPGTRRVGVLREPGGAAIAGAIGQWTMIQAVAQSFGAELKLINLHEANELERGVTAFARSPNGGLIVVVSAASLTHRELIITLATRHRLPTVYPYRVFATHGGLITYGPDITSQYRRAAGYVDRILKGEKPADLPVQAPTKYELVINLKTAKALGLEVPPTLLARADEVIE
jgi:putative tryptophan/tyrosine transport system substrate-binding protein